VLPYKIINFKLFLQLFLTVTSYVLHLLSELGIYRCPAFLPGKEELYSKKALQRKDNKDQDKLKSAVVGWEAIKLLMFAYYTAVDVPLLFLARQLNCELGGLTELSM